MPLPTLRLPPHGSQRTARGETWFGYSFVPGDLHPLPSASSPGVPDPCRHVDAHGSSLRSIDGKSLARPRVSDFQRGPVFRCQSLHTVPAVAVLLRSAAQSPEPQYFQSLHETPQISVAGWNGKVVQPSIKYLSQPPRGLVYAVVHPPAKLLLYSLQGARHPLRDRLAPQLEPPLPVLRAVVREAQKVERLRFAQPSPLTVLSCEPPELDEPGLVRVQFQFKTSKPLLQVTQKSLRVLLVSPLIKWLFPALTPR